MGNTITTMIIELDKSYYENNNEFHNILFKDDDGVGLVDSDQMI
jgi:hypothetical protein